MQTRHAPTRCRLHSLVAHRRPLTAASTIRVFRDRIICGCLLILGLTLFAGPQCLVAAEPFLDVYSVLRRACFECHGPDKDEGGLRLHTELAIKDSGTVIAGDPDASELMRRIRLPRNHDDLMPAIGEPLSAPEIRNLSGWIEEGAIWPKGFVPPPHWAYVAPVASEVPAIPNPDWPRQPLDYFVARRLADIGWSPSPEADPETLVRRLFLDVVGLPPEPEEVQRFLDDPSDVAYAALVDDLLNRPQFGERWARPWLDLARYADSHGFQRDNLRDIWPYRDWVIRALNQDMPFSQFTIEQLAGDLLPNATESNRIATGFHRCAPTNVEAGSLPEETRTEQVIDRVNTTAAVWLGTTLECAQCHDHKYDPFTAKDYYRLLAFFNNTQREAARANPKQASSIQFLGPYLPVADAATDRRRAAVEEGIAQTKARLQATRQTLENDLQDWAGELKAASESAPQEHVCEVLHFESQGKKDGYELLEDGSILLTGAPPDADVYTVQLRVSVRDVTAIKVEALKHDSLPGKGPGRGDPIRRNFILSEIEAKFDGVARKFSTATADFSQKNWPVSAAIDGKASTGWAVSPKFDNSHWALFAFDERLDHEPVKDDSGEPKEQHMLELKIHQNFGSGRSIGRIRFLAVTGDLKAESLPESVANVLNKSPDQWTPKQRQMLLEERLMRDPTARQISDELAEQTRELTAIPKVQTLVMIELEEPRETRVYQRGDYRNPGELVEAGAPSALPAMSDGPRDRLTLARWLVDRKNPLTARVTVNRWWAELFEEGIVATLEDFGVKGETPSHPAMLDHLAVTFMDNGWSMKSLLRTVLLSSTYRQSSRVTEAMREHDPDNRLLARGPRRRLDAETIRDNALAVSGLLSDQQYGPPIRPFQPDGIWSKVGGTSYKYVTSPGSERHRRGIYVVLKRGAPYPSFVNFDGTARLSCVVKRSRTNTPLQALTLLNDPVYVEAAKALAIRMTVDAGSDAIEQRIAYGFQLCTARKPSGSELQALRSLYDSQLEVVADGDQQTGKTIADGVRLPPDLSWQEFSAWYSIATTLLNLHETITKQ